MEKEKEVELVITFDDDPKLLQEWEEMKAKEDEKLRREVHEAMEELFHDESFINEVRARIEKVFNSLTPEEQDRLKQKLA